MNTSKYVYATILQIQSAFVKNELTVKELVLSFLSRIAEIDSCENGLHAVLEINPDVLFIADNLDKKLQSAEKRGELFGIPVLIKDNINTEDKLHTSAGSVALQNNFAPYDAYIIKKLREADAVILGKANMTEFANFMTDGEMPDGYSSRGEQVINPYNRAKTPSGSSSGSAVAVAAGLCTAAIGTETCGSIVSPAGQNGIVGVKPTLGLVSRNGIIPISNTFDTAGPMARTVEDATILLKVISGVDPKDVSTHTQPEINYTDCFVNNGLQGVKIGIYHPNNANELSLAEERQKDFKKFCCLLSDAGAVLTDNVEINFNLNMWHMTRHEFKASMNHYLSKLGDYVDVKTVSDIIAYNETHAETALKYGQSNLTLIENSSSGNITEPEYLIELCKRENVIDAFDEIFEKYDIDVILCRTFNNIIAPYTGFPSIILPIGQQEDKLPMDCYFIARRFDETTLLKVAYSVEQMLGLLLRPEF